MTSTIMKIFLEPLKEENGLQNNKNMDTFLHNYFFPILNQNSKRKQENV